MADPTSCTSLGVAGNSRRTDQRKPLTRGVLREKQCTVHKSHKEEQNVPIHARKKDAWTLKEGHGCMQLWFDGYEAKGLMYMNACMELVMWRGEDQRKHGAHGGYMA